MPSSPLIRWMLLYPTLLLLGIFSTSCEKKEQTPSWEQTSHISPNITPDSEEKMAATKTDKTKPPQDREKDHTIFMYYNIRNYLTMRRGDSERFKPENEIQALIENIRQVNPDILGVCEIGVEKDLEDFNNRLKTAGVRLPYTYLAMGTDPTRRQAILSKYPITPHKVPKRTYRMNGAEFEIKRGILDASIETPQGRFRFLGTHLKSKRPSKEYDESLVRRNEALILRKHATSLLEGNVDKLIVYGDMNDTKNSPALRTLKGPQRGKLSLRPIELEASDGTRWTQYWSYQDIYSRFDFALTSEAMTQHIAPSASHVLEVPKGNLASDHRALVIIIK